MMNNIAPTYGKPTEYNGHVFRSRLEAQWAYFLDRSGLKWIYEPQRLTLSDGAKYVPDFFLGDCWLEVKGRPTQQSLAKPMQLWEDNGGGKVVIGLNDGQVYVPRLRADGSLSLDGTVVECSSCQGVWFANPLDEDAAHCPHCHDHDGGMLSLMSHIAAKDAGAETCWIGTHNPLAYRDHISDVAA
jgi:hypothetical protein